MTSPQGKEKTQDNPSAHLNERLRTLRQNRSLHKYCEMVARELVNQGQTIQNIISKVDMIEITPTTYTIKEILWKPIQETVLGKRSSTELTTAEVDKVYQIMSMFLSKNFEISLPFPEDLHFEQYLEDNEYKIK